MLLSLLPHRKPKSLPPINDPQLTAPAPQLGISPDHNGGPAAVGRAADIAPQDPLQSGHHPVPANIQPCEQPSSHEQSSASVQGCASGSSPSQLQPALERMPTMALNEPTYMGLQVGHTRVNFDPSKVPSSQAIADDLRARKYSCEFLSEHRYSWCRKTGEEVCRVTRKTHAKTKMKKCLACKSRRGYCSLDPFTP